MDSSARRFVKKGHFYLPAISAFPANLIRFIYPADKYVRTNAVRRINFFLQFSDVRNVLLTSTLMENSASASSISDGLVQNARMLALWINSTTELDALNASLIKSGTLD